MMAIPSLMAGCYAADESMLLHHCAVHRSVPVAMLKSSKFAVYLEMECSALRERYGPMSGEDCQYHIEST